MEKDIMRVDPTFKKKTDELQKQILKKNGLNLSRPQITRILADVIPTPEEISKGFEILLNIRKKQIVFRKKKNVKK